MAERRHGEDDLAANGGSGPAGQVDAVAFLRVSDGLREAFAQVSAAKLRPDEASRWQRRLLAITNVAKRDLARALEQLERFEADWAHRRR